MSGAAPIRESTKKYFESLGLFISELYGSTETSGPTSTILEKRKFKRICYVIEFSDLKSFCSLLLLKTCLYVFCFFLESYNRDATCGKSFPGMQVEIMDPDFVTGDGEIIINSRTVFMGYVKVAFYQFCKNFRFE